LRDFLQFRQRIVHFGIDSYVDGNAIPVSEIYGLERGLYWHQQDLHGVDG
jgi:hypothetical protein